MLLIRSSFLCLFLTSIVIAEVNKCDHGWEFFEDSCYFIESLYNTQDGTKYDSDDLTRKVFNLCDRQFSSESARITSPQLNQKVVEWVSHTNIPCGPRKLLFLHLPIMYADDFTLRLQWVPDKYDNEPLELDYSNFIQETGFDTHRRRAFMRAVMVAKVCAVATAEGYLPRAGEWGAHLWSSIYMCQINLTRVAVTLPWMSDVELDTLFAMETSYARRRIYFIEKERRTSFRRRVRLGVIVVILLSCLLAITTGMFYRCFYRNRKHLREIEKVIRSITDHVQNITIDQRNLLTLLETIGMTYEEYDAEQRSAQHLVETGEDLLLSSKSPPTHSCPTQKENDHSTRSRTEAKNDEKQPKEIDAKTLKMWMKFKSKIKRTKGELKPIEESEGSVNDFELPHAEDDFISPEPTYPVKDLFRAPPPPRSPPTPLNTAISTRKSERSNSAHRSATNTFSSHQKVNIVEPPAPKRSSPPQLTKAKVEKPVKTASTAATSDSPPPRNANTSSQMSERMVLMSTQSIDDKSSKIGSTKSKSVTKSTKSTSGPRTGRKYTEE